MKKLRFQREHSKIIREMRRYEHDERERPRRKRRACVFIVVMLFALLWTLNAPVAGIAWIIFLIAGIWLAFDIRYLMHKDPMNSIIDALSQQFEKDNS